MNHEQARHPSSPQAREMADESMVRNLAAKAEAIWPQEEPIFARHPVGRGAVLDLGCGTGEITARLAAAFPEAWLVGVDHITADTSRVPRDTFARIWEARRDGCTETIAVSMLFAPCDEALVSRRLARGNPPGHHGCYASPRSRFPNADRDR